MEAPQKPIGPDIDELYRTYGDMVYRLALVRTQSPADAEDVAQEVFLRCLRRAPVFTDGEHQKAWLITVTINCSKSLLGSAFRRRTVPLDAVAEPGDDGAMPDSTVYDAVQRLPQKLRTAIHLHYYEDYSVKEIAAAMQASESAVKTWLFRARAQLKTELKGAYADDNA
ncbi:MAG: RNA polymerase sigma factor [Clostridia bacterium]|nr:RNA polymerase sigma factor [Clostridia bacterium]MBR3289214.1 RNA polymerase sigma factor [Clostridia bacterium]